MKIKNLDQGLIGKSKQELIIYIADNYYWAYRFDKSSNFITFEEWITNYVEKVLSER